ncbi:hypothetical protein BaRGS_00015588 [Batillaria attramentaria]|uniref:Uncharacterized protein n=1 Tax=Batillaria attramentaria TaxID=370345 RepID=A0ABD0L1Y5_9CAEN
MALPQDALNLQSGGVKADRGADRTNILPASSTRHRDRGPVRADGLFIDGSGGLRRCRVSETGEVQDQMLVFEPADSLGQSGSPELSV